MSDGTSFPPLIDTERLVLRRFSEAEWPGVRSVWADPEVRRSLWGLLQPDDSFVRARFDHHLGRWERDGFGLFAAIDRATGETAGLSGPSHPDFVDGLEREVEVGWSFRPAFQGRGLATEAGGAAMEAVFDHLPVTRAISLIAPANERSIAVAGRLGMRLDTRVTHARTGEPLSVYELRR